ncbi:unnamed protein product, partial [Ectocarpus sp. 8 AP-2014]
SSLGAGIPSSSRPPCGSGNTEGTCRSCHIWCTSSIRRWRSQMREIEWRASRGPGKAATTPPCGSMSATARVPVRSLSAWIRRTPEVGLCPFHSCKGSGRCGRKFAGRV